MGGKRPEKKAGKGVNFSLMGGKQVRHGKGTSRELQPEDNLI